MLGIKALKGTGKGDSGRLDGARGRERERTRGEGVERSEKHSGGGTHALGEECHPAERWGKHWSKNSVLQNREGHSNLLLSRHCFTQ